MNIEKREYLRPDWPACSMYMSFKHFRRVHANCPPEICPLPKALFQKLFSKCPPNLTALPKNCPHPKTLFQKPSSKCPLCQMPSAIYSLPFALLQMPSTKRGNWQRAFDRGQLAEGKWQRVICRGQLAEGKCPSEPNAL